MIYKLSAASKAAIQIFTIIELLGIVVRWWEKQFIKLKIVIVILVKPFILKKCSKEVAARTPADTVLLTHQIQSKRK